MRASSRTRPSSAEVVVLEPLACTPRTVMQVCSADRTTPDAAGGQVLVEPAGDLLGHPLLHLRPLGEQLHDPGQLGQPEDPLAGQVADGRGPGEGQQVVLADRGERDVLGDDHLVVALVVGEGRHLERARVEHLGEGARHPRRGPVQARQREVHAERLEERAGGDGGGVEVRARASGR